MQNRFVGIEAVVGVCLASLSPALIRAPTNAPTMLLGCTCQGCNVIFCDNMRVYEMFAVSGADPSPPSHLELNHTKSPVSANESFV